MNSSSNPIKQDAKRHKFGMSALLYTTAFGLLVITVGMYAIQSATIDKSWPHTQGKVVSTTQRTPTSSHGNNTLYTPVINYEVAGTTYNIHGEDQPDYPPVIGSPAQVAYDPAQPSKAKVVPSSGNVTNTRVYLIPIIGIQILILGPFFFVRSLRRSSKITNLVQSGTKIHGVISYINTIRNDNIVTYKIVVTADDSQGGTKSYTSDAVSGIGNFAEADFYKTPITIDVYLDPINSRNYYVDIANISNLLNEHSTELLSTATEADSSMPDQTPPYLPPS